MIVLTHIQNLSDAEGPLELNKQRRGGAGSLDKTNRHQRLQEAAGLKNGIKRLQYGKIKNDWFTKVGNDFFGGGRGVG